MAFIGFFLGSFRSPRCRRTNTRSVDSWEFYELDIAINRCLMARRRKCLARNILIWRKFILHFYASCRDNWKIYYFCLLSIFSLFSLDGNTFKGLICWNSHEKLNWKFCAFYRRAKIEMYEKCMKNSDSWSHFEKKIFADKRTFSFLRRNENFETVVYRAKLSSSISNLTTRCQINFMSQLVFRPRGGTWRTLVPRLDPVPLLCFFPATGRGVIQTQIY